ncbi:MAG TPA: MFS transporter [Ornithinibacter sp.]|nr:MFS transporter [Ornithinibacter sp.]
MTTSGTATPTPAADSPERPVRLLAPANLPVVVGVVALVTLAAFENRAVSTILPTVVRELDGWALFGASTGATLVTFTIAMAWSGGWTDRAGPRPVLLWGMASFVVAQVVSGLAPTMGVFVVGRAASGAAEALIDTALMVLVAQALPEALRAKIFASFAAAWILPSLLGPSLAGAIDGLWGWRTVFVAPLLVAPVALVLLRPALRRTHAGGASATGAEATASERRRVVAALLLAAGLAVTTFSAPLLSDADTRLAGVVVIAAGAVLVVVGAVRALPHGVVRLARGVPSVIAVRMLVSAAFTAVAGLIPLMLVQTHGASTAVAGVSLSVTGCLWAAGSFLNSTNRVQADVSAPTRAAIGAGLIAVGSLGPVLLSLDVIGLVPGMLAWAVAALGMGIVSPTLSTQLLSLAPVSEQGRVSAAQGLAISTGVALSTGVVGAVVALRGAETDGLAFGLLMAGGAACALVAALAAGRTAHAA